MPFTIILNQNQKQTRKASLQSILAIAFVLQICGAVGLVGWLSFRHGQQAIKELVTNLQRQAANTVSHNLEDYLSAPKVINQINKQAIQSGLLKLSNMDNMGSFFWKQVQLFHVSYINFGTPSGELVGAERKPNGKFGIDLLTRDRPGRLYEYATDSKGNRTKLLNQYPYNHRLESWYANAVQASKPVWSDVYQWDGMPGVLAISASYPLYDARSKLIGVLGVDRVISDMSNSLRQIQIGRSSVVFIVERSGFLVASSSSHPSFALANGEAKRILASQSGDPLVKATAAHLVGQFGDLATIQADREMEFSIAGEKQFVQVLPWRDEMGLDWLIAIVIPESDFMEHIRANTRSTILLCLAAFFSSMFMTSLTARWLATPILQLSQASKEITEGDLKQTVDIIPPLSWLPQISEVEELAESFNRMSVKLQDSFEALEAANVELESRIEQRTAELRTSLAEKEILLREIHHRVKNNLHVISNLLDMQADSIEDERVLSFLSDSQDRIQAMALIHDHLYQLAHSGFINIDDYIQRLVENLLLSYSEVNGNVRAILEIEPVKLAIETAIPCGLLINELVTNSLKYAFPNRQPGEIHIELHQEAEQKLHLYVWDNGIGIPDSLDWQNSNSLGLKLIGLFSQQLRADMHHAFANGVFFHFAFEPLKYKPRF
ncbi:histidine kinase dimerization/phosphoacceptor domain -containing protein [Pseudanabaena sp. PCC 6802]|uniref:histidine kinase dimerization/phosphoacceptor domain -containing protein n=1 Tax=Pseudanabaena sp. PCC 6802 TaxID=118173 RepID=UPI00034C225E|nr:histidine kinase dimerization/phosphoacceptor domain -containing protein [Pseudanabaena sp. PCC 6802]